MRTKYLLTVLMICTMVLSTYSFASSPERSRSAFTTEFIEDNLLEGLSSDNLGLRISTAYFLGEFRTEKAVIPLIKMLHNEKEEGARIQAALSLIKIGNPKGVFMVKQAAKFDESKRVRNLCSKFYNAFTLKQVN